MMKCLSINEKTCWIYNLVLIGIDSFTQTYKINYQLRQIIEYQLRNETLFDVCATLASYLSNIGANFLLTPCNRNSQSSWEYEQYVGLHDDRSKRAISDTNKDFIDATKRIVL